MKIARLDMIVGIGLFILSLFIVVQALLYGIIGDNVTGSGFFPLISGVMLFVCSIGVLADRRSREEFKDRRISLGQLKPVIGITLATIAFILLIPVFGMVPLTVAYIPAVAYCIQWPARARGHLLVWGIAVVAAAGFYFLFDQALNLPMPWGLWE